MKPTLLATFCVLLSACAISPEYRARQQAEQREGELAYYAKLEEQCIRFGFRPGTDAFAGCVQNQHICEQRKQRAQTAYLNNLNAMGRRRGTTFIQNAGDAARLTDTSTLCH